MAESHREIAPRQKFMTRSFKEQRRTGVVPPPPTVTGVTHAVPLDWEPPGETDEERHYALLAEIDRRNAEMAAYHEMENM